MFIYSLSFWLVSVSLGMALACPWLDFGALGSLWVALGPLAGPSGIPWGSLGVPLGVPWGSLGDPLGCPGVFWGCLGVLKAILSDLSNNGRPIPSKCV